MGALKNIFKKFASLINVLALLLLVFVAFKLISVSSAITDLDDENNTFIKEIGENRVALLAMQDGINDLRGFMGYEKLNVVNFDDEISGEGNDAANSDRNQDELQLKLFEYVNYVSESQVKDEKNEFYTSLLTDLSNSETLTTLLTNKNLILSELTIADESALLTVDTLEGLNLIKFYLDKNEATLYKKTPLKKDVVEFEDYNSFELALSNDLNTNFEVYMSKATDLQAKKLNISETLNTEEIATYATENELTFSELVDEELSSEFSVIKNDETLAKITLNYEDLLFTLTDLNDAENLVTADSLSNSLLPFLKNLSANVDGQVETVNKVEQIKTYLKDSGFVATMEAAGITISDETTEDDIRIYFKVMDKDGNHISSIVVEKATNVVNIVTPDGTNSQNLLYFEADEGKKKMMEIPDVIPEYSETSKKDENSFNILIAGKHGNLVDTMIFAHIDEIEKTVRMISIPRDLFYNGRKINSFAYFYGMDELKVALSEMTGYELDKYILIDMYAFIDVINLIGGIDVHLDKAVIDPTYVTEDDGIWSTLHYEPGDYHFSGKQALRIARSRHTSSDFARAERQQIIIESIQNKARNMGFGDADTLYEIAKTVLAKTDTDIDIDEAIRYYFKYQNYEIISNNVMSSGNVLYVPPYTTKEQCAAKIAAAEAAGEPRPGCENENQAYTLLPRDNNWNVIKWFFEQNFEG